MLLPTPSTDAAAALARHPAYPFQSNGEGLQSEHFKSAPSAAQRHAANDFGAALSTLPALSVKTTRRGDVFCQGEAAEGYPAFTPHADLDALFILTDGAAGDHDALTFDNFMSTYVKNEALSPGPLSMPCTSTLAAAFNNASLFNSEPPATRHTWVEDESCKRRKLIQKTRELQQRAQVLWERENFELDRGAALQIIKPFVHRPAAPLQQQQSLPKVPSPSTVAHLRDCNPLGSPNSFALMAAYMNPHGYGSPTCFAEVRLLDNTPIKPLGDYNR